MTWRWRRAFALALALTNRNVWGSSSRHCSAICDRSGLLVTRTLTICSIVRPEYIVHSLIKCDNDRKLFSGYDLKCFQIQRVSFQRYLSSSSSSSSSSGSVSDGGDDEYDETLSWYDIDTPEFVQLVTEYQEGKRKNVLLVDVREPEELNESGVIPGTINIPLGVIEEELSLGPDVFEERYGVPKPTQDTDIVFHCRAGVRSLAAIETANKLGYSRARHYMRGFLGWRHHLDHLETDSN